MQQTEWEDGRTDGGANSYLENSLGVQWLYIIYFHEYGHDDDDVVVVGTRKADSDG